MKIAIDAIPLMFEKSGIGNYTRSLVAQFLKVAPEHEYYLSDALCRSGFANYVRIEGDLGRDNLLYRVFRTPFPLVTLARLALFLSGAASRGRRLRQAGHP